MKLLIADDHVFFRKLLERILAPSYELLMEEGGAEAWQLLQQPDSARLAILDWVMPTFTGPQLCRKIRQSSDLSSMYLIILTAKRNSALTSALCAGTDDYVTKAFDVGELRARIRIGPRVVDLQTTLAERAAGLENAVSQARQLRALLPVRPNGGKLRADGKYWHKLKRSLARYSQQRPHDGMCPDCLQPVLNPAFELTSGSWGGMF